MLFQLRFAQSLVLVFLFWSQTPAPQQSPSPQPSATPQPAAEKKLVMETPARRLASAQNVLIIRSRGNRIPFDVIRSTVEGWERFTLVESRDKADLIIEVSSNGDSGVQVSSSSNVSADTGQEEKSTSTRRDISPNEVRMTVTDARNKRLLWSGTESVKFAMKEKGKENNLVDAAGRLAARFHEKLEPPAAR